MITTNKTLTETEKRLQAAILANVSKGPRLLRDIIDDLRCDGWKKFPGTRVDQEDLVLSLGFHTADADSGAGAAVFVGKEPFFSVVLGRHRKATRVRSRTCPSVGHFVLDTEE